LNYTRMPHNAHKVYQNNICLSIILSNIFRFFIKFFLYAF